MYVGTFKNEHLYWLGTCSCTQRCGHRNHSKLSTQFTLLLSHFLITYITLCFRASSHLSTCHIHCHSCYKFKILKKPLVRSCLHGQSEQISTNTLWRMDGEWTKNIFALGSYPLANHGNKQKNFQHSPSNFARGVKNVYNICIALSQGLTNELTIENLKNLHYILVNTQSLPWFLVLKPKWRNQIQKPWKTFSMTWSKLDMIWCTLLVFKVQEDYTSKSVHLICKFCQLLVPWVVWAFFGHIKLLFKSNQFHTEQSITESNSCKGFFDGLHMDDVWGVLVHPSTKL